MYNYLLISWIAHHAKKVTGNTEQRHFSSLCLSDQRRSDRSCDLLGSSTSSTLYSLAEAEVWLISWIHLVPRRIRANLASLVQGPEMLTAMAVAAITFRVLCRTCVTLHCAMRMRRRKRTVPVWGKTKNCTGLLFSKLGNAIPAVAASH